MIEAESREHRGITSWVSSGLKIQESQISLSAQIRKLGRSWTKEQKLDIAKKRQKLQTRIEQFNKKILHFIPDDIDPANFVDAEDGDQDMPEYLEETPEDEDNVFTEHPASRSQRHAENHILYLPSFMGEDKAELETLVEAEKQLRQGQANDALHELRIALSQKSVTFRTQIRAAKTQMTKTRAWTRVNNLDAQVRQHGRIYTAARKAMLALGMEGEEMDNYKPLTRDDLKVETAVLDPSIRGQRHLHLPWFWRLDVAGDSEDNNSMEQCKSVIYNRSLVLIQV